MLIPHLRFAFVAALATLALVLGVDAASPRSASAFQHIHPTSCTEMATECPNLPPNVYIGPYSCDGPAACADLGDGAWVSWGSCLGEDACNGLNGWVGIGSCDGYQSCMDAGSNEGFFWVGNYSCVSSTSGACANSGFAGYSKIGHVSCLEDNACYGTGADSGKSVITNHACQGDSSCYRNGQIGGEGYVSSGSCIGTNACLANGNSGYGSVREDACHGAQACAYNGSNGYGTIDDGSCVGPQVCFENGVAGATGEVGKNSCQNNDAPNTPCYQNTGVIGDCMYSMSGVCQFQDRLRDSLQLWFLNLINS